MKSIQVFKKETDEIIASFEELPSGKIIGIIKDGYEATANGKELIKENLKIKS